MIVHTDFHPKTGDCQMGSVASLGMFDGVHRGHRRILDRVVSHARVHGVHAVVLTFDQHPLSVIRSHEAPTLITSIDEKLALLAESGIDHTYILQFTREIAAMESERFIAEYLIDCLGMREFVVGYDHGLGRGREGSPDAIRGIAERLGFALDIVGPVSDGGTVIKSSTIRNHLALGDVVAAAEELGRSYSLRGTVERGRGIGSGLGYPTANVTPIDPGKIVPGNGVYTGWVEVSGTRHDAVITIGPRPTFDLTDELIEAHLPGYSGDMYGAEVVVGLTGRIRNIMKFESTSALIKNIQRDIEHLYHTKQPEE